MGWEFKMKGGQLTDRSYMTEHWSETEPSRIKASSRNAMAT